MRNGKCDFSEMPYVKAMDFLLKEKNRTGACGIRMMVKRGKSITENDIARAYMSMEEARKDAPILDDIGF